MSEKIALGMHRGGGGQLAGEALFDSRLFNQSAGLCPYLNLLYVLYRVSVMSHGMRVYVFCVGMDSGFSAEDEYGVYSKPLFDRSQATSSIYRPKRDDAEMYGDADTQLAKLSDTSRFAPDKAFKGTEGVRNVTRSEPVQFERSSDRRRDDEEEGGDSRGQTKKSRRD